MKRVVKYDKEKRVQEILSQFNVTREFALDFLKDEEKRCEYCPLGNKERTVGNGITESPYVYGIRCPFEKEYYKSERDTCNHEKEKEETLLEMSEIEEDVRIVGFIHQYNEQDDYSLSIVEISKEDEEVINNILSKYKNEGYSIRGNQRELFIEKIM